MEIGLYFGSFNPIHVGHLIIAQAVLDLSKLDEVWFIVSPQNPLKQNKTLLHEFDRYDMVKLAIENNDRFKVSDIEFNMPRPSYTIDTLTYLKERHHGHRFRLIIGGDNLTIFPKWKNSERIIKDFG
ncbi:MAG: nicotinate (nicotinamide) nucleotide adenylyltransferase, partial [Cyclobacteriaceae bacterium]|nr:nicotinate (nicotinamide) nucleotide adenylyltransferase [Cyclobacteriaceae bacterium]